MKLDQAAGMLFDAHVIAGYAFVMRYYNPGDKIFIFGFSRGAFTARFLARMICAIGLLSKGNEEMVNFAYRRYQDSLLIKREFKGMSEEEIKEDLRGFRKTFCQDVMPYFVGLWDTVNSVGVFRLPAPHAISGDGVQYDSIADTATYVRHAVSIDERRSKFRPALLCPGATPAEEVMKETTKEHHRGESRHTAHGQKGNLPGHGQKANASKRPANIREMFFAGQHGDIGGGWPTTDAETGEDDNSRVQLSDITLNWMLEELDAINAAAEREEHRLAFSDQKASFQKNFRERQRAVMEAKIHDTLKFEGGEKGSISTKGILFWKFLGKSTPSSIHYYPHRWRRATLTRKSVNRSPTSGSTRAHASNLANSPLAS